ncbi:MAG: LacI family DNA-binding transcriptional regulator [Acutalibacter sp.]|jgi:DNA-binding LacI/PurR family transcriptional regulator
MKINIKKLSELTGFSQATVSNALNNKKGVNKETAEKIRKVARETGYLSDLRISSVKLVVYRASGAIVNDSPFFSSLIGGVEAEGRRQGYDTLVCNLTRDSADYEDQLRELCSDPSSALLVLATELEPSEAKHFEEAVPPVVMLDNWYENLPLTAVLIDNIDAASRAVRYLIQKGHKKIGHLKGSYAIRNFGFREEGYLRTLMENNLEYNPDYTFCLTPSMEGAWQDMSAILQREPDLPTAFFADNDMIALGAMRALQQNGYSVPEDVSVVGFDDLPFCAISNPPLTTVKVENYRMGIAAVRCLMELVRDNMPCCVKMEVRSSFIERDSVRNLLDQEG